MRFILIFFLFFLSISCAKKTSEEVDDAIDIALTYLSDDKCNDAIDILEDVGRQTTNGVYLQVLASAYACRAGYSTIDFLATEVSKIDTDAADLMKSITTLVWSDVETEADSSEYQDLREALDILLYVDSNQPSQANREAIFGTRKAGDIGSQALLLSIAQLGKFLHFYGNVDSTGAKGTGAASTDEQGATPSTCFVEYTYASATTFLSGGGGGVCNNMATDDGHPNLSFAAPDLATTKSRMCEGLMLVTNIIDILDNLTLDADTYGDMTTLSASINTYKTAITTADPALGTLINTTSQAECETLVASASEFDNLQYIYALLFEAGLP